MTSHRELQRELGNNRVSQQKDGSLIISGVTLLASGTWTDSAYGTPCYYSPMVLEKYAGNWVDPSLWARHSGGVPRAITEKVGEIQNPRYENEAVVGDIVMHGLNQMSRDAIEMVVAELANYVSVECYGLEHWDADNDRYVAEDLTFYGIAVVNMGACETCKLNESQSSAEANGKMTKELEEKLTEAEGKISELSAASEAKDVKLVELETKLGEIDNQLVELAKMSESIREFEEKMEELKQDEPLAELEARVDKIEKTPNDPVTSGGFDTIDMSEIDPFVQDSEGFTRRMF